MNSVCAHFPSDLATPKISGDGCKTCLASGRDDWVHLRYCQTCGVVGCCDDSPGQHATQHFAQTGHAVARSFEPGEDWWWCFADEIGFELEGAPPAPSHSAGS